MDKAVDVRDEKVQSSRLSTPVPTAPCLITGARAGHPGVPAAVPRVHGHGGVLALRAEAPGRLHLVARDWGMEGPSASAIGGPSVTGGSFII